MPIGGMDFCDLITALRPFFFPKDRDITLISGRVFDGLGIVPIGGVIMWSGAVGAIPTGWAICDGNNGTPDLRNRFVIGAGDTYAVDATGGSTTKDVSHTHDVTGWSSGESAHTHGVGSYSTDTEAVHSHSISNDGDHSHALSGPVQNIPNDGITYDPSTDTQGDHDHGGGTGTGGSHSHSVTGGSSGTGSNHSHADGTYAAASGGSAVQDIMPPYYALAYIMRVS